MDILSGTIEILDSNMQSDMLTKEEKELISMIVCDDETGNHLLGRKRPEEYWAMRDELFVARKTMTHTQRQVDLLECYHQHSDYDYFKSLPEEKRMF